MQKHLNHPPGHAAMGCLKSTVINDLGAAGHSAHATCPADAGMEIFSA